MSERKGELIRRAIDLWNAGDLDAGEELHHADVVIVAPDGWPESGTFEGWNAVRRQYARLKDSWSDERAEVVEVIPVDDERVLTRFRWVARGAASGMELDAEMFRVDTVREGLIARTDYFMDRAQALRAAGLEGEAER